MQGYVRDALVLGDPHKRVPPEAYLRLINAKDLTTSPLHVCGHDTHSIYRRHRRNDSELRDDS